MNLRELRKQRGLSQAELAKRADVSYQHISRIENGHMEPSEKTARLLCRALEVESLDDPVVDDHGLFEPAKKPDAALGVAVKVFCSGYSNRHDRPALRVQYRLIDMKPGYVQAGNVSSWRCPILQEHWLTEPAPEWMVEQLTVYVSSLVPSLILDLHKRRMQRLLRQWEANVEHSMAKVAMYKQLIEEIS